MTELLTLLFFLLSQFKLVMFKIVSVPLGILIGLEQLLLFLLVFGFDIVQMFFFAYILNSGDSHGRLRNFFLKILPKKEKVESHRIVKRMETMGYFGTAILAAMPVYAGGMWSAVITSHLMGLFEKNKMKCFIYLSLGSAIGSAIIVVGLYNILRWIGALA